MGLIDDYTYERRDMSLSRLKVSRQVLFLYLPLLPALPCLSVSSCQRHAILTPHRHSPFSLVFRILPTEHPTPAPWPQATAFAHVAKKLAA